MELMEAPLTEQVPHGCKRTEVGVIPNDWEVKRVGTLVSQITVGFVGSMLHLFVRNGVPLLRGTNVEPHRLVLEDLRYISATTHKLWKKSALEEGDVVIVRVGYPGTAAVVPKWLGEANAASLVVVRPRNELLDSRYLCFVLNSSWGKAQVLARLVGGAQQVFNTRTASDFEIPLPPLPEQRAIATALSDVDGLLAGLDALIAKKKALKQGAMQQLLTGKQRLPGFKGEWVVRRLGELGSVYGGLTGKSKADFGTGNARYIPFMNIMQGPIIDTGFLEQVRVGAHESQNRAMKGDLFFNGSSETPEEVGMCSVLREDIPNLYLNSFSFGFRLQKDRKTEPMFLSYWFRSPAGRQVIYSSAQGATRYNLAKSNFLRLEVPCPSPEEQTAIAEVLSDMDAELGALEARRAKTALLKQGMMQELLTGRVRLV